MATQPELMTALRNADAAGDVEAATRIAAMISAGRAEPEPLPEVAAPQEQPEPSFAGAADVVGSGLAGIGEDIIAGYGGMIAGRDIPQSVAVTEGIKNIIPDYEVGAKGKEFNQWLSTFLSEAYQDHVPDTLKPQVERLIGEIQGGSEEVFTRGMDTANRLTEKGHPLLSDLVRSTTPALAATVGAIPTIAEGSPALKIPSMMGKAGAVAQRVTSPEKREIAKQLERGALEGDYIPAEGTDIIPADPWTTGPQVVDADDLGLSGSTTSTAPYKLNKHGKLIDNPKHKIAQEAGFSDAILSFTERVNPDTRVKLNKMLNSRERLFETPESSVVNDPSIVTGDSLDNRLKIVKKVNREAGQNIDKYVKNTLGEIELNTIPLMDEVAEKWAKQGVNLDTNTWEIDYGDMELNEKGQAVINNLLDEMKEIQTTPTGRTVHNLKRRIDEDIAYGKKLTGLDAKTQGLLTDFRLSTKEFLEKQFPEYARANAEYSKTVDVINRIQKAAGKVDLDGEFSDANLGRMSRAIMSQRISRDEIATAIKDLDAIAVGNGYKLKDDLTQQVYFANQLDDIWGPSRATGFAGQTKQGAASAAADVAGGGIQGGVAMGKKAMDLLKKKQLDDKAKFKAMRKILK